MKTSTIVVTIIAVILIAAGVWYVVMREKAPAQEPVVETPVVTPPATQSYASSTMGISFEYPSEYVLNAGYAYNKISATKLIRGVSVTIPMSMATGTNLSSDTYLSVEQLPNARKCSGDIFVLPNVKPQTLTEGGVEYSVATTADAAAGNLYEELVYAVSGSKPCTAVRYLIHSTNIGNYPAGTVTEFDRAKLLSDFDTVRRSVIFTATSSPSI